MPQFYTLLTDVGQAKLANAVALKTTIEITELAVGDGGGSLPEPDSDAESLVNEVRRASINASQTDPDNPSWIVVEQVLPPDVGGWTIREIGIYDTDGDLIGIGNYPETYKPVLAEGSSRTQTVRFVLEVSDTSAVTLKVDPSVVLATREYVDGAVQEHAESRDHPAGTTSEPGMMQFATKQEHLDGQRDDRSAKPSGVKAMLDARIADQPTVDAGENDTKFVTAKKLKNWVKQATESVMGLIKVATQSQVENGTNDKTSVTPKKLLSGFSVNSGFNGYIVLPKWLFSIIIQWSQVNLDTGEGETFSHPMSFSEEAWTAVSTDYGSGDIFTVRVDNLNANNITLSAIGHNSGYGGGKVNYIAIGR